MEDVPGVEPSQNLSGGSLAFSAHTVPSRWGMQSQKDCPTGVPPWGRGRRIRRDYLVASAMALFAKRSASARAASTVASWCHTFWMALPVASMIPLKPRLMGSLIP